MNLMAKLPKVVGLVVCDRMDVNPQSGQVSLVGILQALRFSVFPSPVRQFTVYAALADGSGEGTIELVVSRVETETDRYRQRRWCTFPDRPMVVNLEFTVRCVFPTPGRYMITLRFDGTILTNRYFDIFTE
jgi:hypothetical protein